MTDGPEGYKGGSQCANALPLVAGLVPLAQAERRRVVEALVRSVEGNGYALTAGDVGHRYLLRALADAGRSDVIHKLHSKTDTPGYGYQLAKGCTSLAEAWDAAPHSSQNHFMLGQIMEWFYGDLAGIRPDADSRGWSNILVRPQPVEGITWAKARQETPRGPVSVEWRKESDTFTLDLSLPANTSTHLILPVPDGATVTEGKQPVEKREGIKELENKNGFAFYRLGGGKYQFQVRHQ